MAEEEAKVPAWLVTFSDLMTLLLTFFVLLLSMSTIDNKKKLVVLGSVHAAFGVVEGKKVPEDSETSTSIEYGVFTQDEAQDMLSERVEQKTNSEEDIEFIIDRDIPIISLSDSVLFERGAYILTEKGKRAIDRLMPIVLEAQKPIKILGSASGLYDEFKTIDSTTVLSPMWKLSLYRALAIYMYMKERNMPVQKMLLEGIGEFNILAKDRNNERALRRARRIDIILDKNDMEMMKRLENIFETDKKSSVDFKGFEFSVSP